jgi:hypothetical protein
MANPIIEPITDSTLPEFAEFLHAQLDDTRSPQTWLANLRTNWSATRPNYGFLLRDGGRLVGGIGAYYADRVINGRPTPMCNITSWCVLDEYRRQSMRLALAIVAQPGYHFTDFSPTKVVAGVLQFLKFRPLDVRQAVVLNLPWPTLKSRLLTRPGDIEAALRGDALEVYRDHARFPWLRHVLVGNDHGWCHVIYKRWRFKGLPAARFMHVGDARLFQRHFPRLAAHLLARGMVSSHVDCRLLNATPWPARIRADFTPRLYLSPTLAPEDIDYLYSESMALDL